MKKKILSLIILMGISFSVYSQTDVVVVSGNTHSGCYNSNPVTSAPQQKWEFEMPATNCSDPIIVGDKILVSAYDKENSKGYQFALDKNTGKQIWRNNIPEQLSTPTVKGDKAFYGSKSKLTIALDLNNGDEVWRNTDISDMTCVAPAIIDDRVYFGTHGREWCIVDINNGRLIKKQTVEKGICCFPSWDNKHVYFTDWAGNLHKQDIFSLTDTEIIYRTDKSSHVAPTITGNTGIMANDKGLLIAVNLDTGKEIWSFKAGSGLWRSPSVKDSICIIITDDSHIYGIDIKKGNAIWEVKKEGTIYTSASIADDIAYISCGDKKMYAFGIYDGEEIWNIRLDDVAGQPFVENKTLYFTSGEKVYAYHNTQLEIAGNSNHNFCFQGKAITSFNGFSWTYQIENEGAAISIVTNDMVFCNDSKGYLYAIDSKTGNSIWKFNAESKLYDGPNIKDNTAYLGTANGTVFSIDLSTGKENWRIKTNGNVCFPPNLKDNLGYALSHDKKLYIFDLESGEIRDTIRENHILCGTPRIEHDNIYYTDWGRNFHCVDLNSREKKWTFNTNEDSEGLTNPSVSDSPAYFVYDSTLFAIDSESGNLLRTFKSDGGIIRTPAFKDNLIVFTTLNSHIYALDITKKEAVWDFRSEGMNWSRPIIVEDVVYYASGNGVIYALDLMTGNELWKYKLVNGISTPYYYDEALYIASGKTVYKME
jgi:outer membrane protein assembly factor BamB